jgi:hypothetical protein
VSTRDIEALFADERDQSLLSGTAVSDITQTVGGIRSVCQPRSVRVLIAERLHLDNRARRCWLPGDVLADGHKVLLHLAPGSKEDTASCREFFQNMRSDCWSSPTVPPA